MLLVRCSRIWISDGHDGDCLCLLTFSYALGSSQHCELCSREWVEWLHVSRNVPKGSQRELPSKCRCTKKTPKEQLNPHYIFPPSLKGQLYMELFWIFASEKMRQCQWKIVGQKEGGWPAIDNSSWYYFLHPAPLHWYSAHKHTMRTV